MEISDFSIERRWGTWKYRLSSIWDPNSMSSPEYCWDEETPQNHRTRTRSNRLVASLWDHHSRNDKEAWQKPMQGTQLSGTFRSFYSLYTKGVRIDS
jgi:hypothetical protein